MTRYTGTPTEYRIRNRLFFGAVVEKRHRDQEGCMSEWERADRPVDLLTINGIREFISNGGKL